EIALTAVYAARRDPRFSYCLYVPAGYRSGPVRPELLGAVHGSPRTFMEFRNHFQDFGDDFNTLVLCPLFPVGVNGDGNADGYKYLTEAGIRYDDVLLDTAAEAKERGGLSCDRFGLFCFARGT